MNLLKLSWKNLTSKPLAMLLSLILFALGTGMISMLLLANKQIQEKFENNLAGIDLVIGAKGSPLQMILCNMYHIDVPTGNVGIKEVKAFMNPKHPLIKEAIPLSLGDSYKGHRIVGTTHEYLNLYNGKIAEGRLWQKNFEVTVGAAIAADLNLKLGDEFNSSHGFVLDDNLVHDHNDKFKVVGILAPSNSVLDQLVLTETKSIWDVHGDHSHDENGGHGEEAHDHDGHDHDHGDHDHDHGDHDHDHEGHDHHGHNHGDHDHDHDNDHSDHQHGDGHDHASHDHNNKNNTLTNAALMNFPDNEITSLLVKFKGRNFQTLSMQRSINENTDMQAATPAIEINRLHLMMGVGLNALRALALLIVFVSGLSIFISLFNSLKDRKYELALIRVMGASKWKLFALVIMEGLILATLGYLFGMLLSHVGMSFLADHMKDAYRYSFTGWTFLKEEVYLFVAALFIGIIAAIIPAYQASKTDIAETLVR